MERLLLTLQCERGELFYVKAGRRVLLANCTPMLKIYEHTDQVHAVGGCGVKRIHAALVLCEDPEFTRPVDTAFLDSVECFDLTADIQCKNGVFEVFHFRNIQPHSIELEGEWVFALNEKPELFRRLLTL